MYNTVSLEVAKKLKEAGWEKKCYWFYGDNEGEFVIYNSSMYCRDGNSNDLESPQLHEILEELPATLTVDGIDFDLKMIKQLWEDLIITYEFYYESIGFIPTPNVNPHDAAAKLLIWAVENKFVTL